MAKESDSSSGSPVLMTSSTSSSSSGKKDWSAKLMGVISCSCMIGLNASMPESALNRLSEDPRSLAKLGIEIVVLSNPFGCIQVFGSALSVGIPGSGKPKAVSSNSKISIGRSTSDSPLLSLFKGFAATLVSLESCLSFLMRFVTTISVGLSDADAGTSGGEAEFSNVSSWTVSTTTSFFVLLPGGLPVVKVVSPKGRHL